MADEPEWIVTKGLAKTFARKCPMGLQFSEFLGNVSEARRWGGAYRTNLYQWKGRLQIHGPEVLKDLPPVCASRPQDHSYFVLS